MKNWRTYFMGMMLVSFFFISCNKSEDDEEEVAAPEPSISFLSIEPAEVTEFDNQIKIVIGYKDNNGDLGSYDPDVFALEVKDSRLDSADLYHVPPLAPVDEELIIQGELNILVNNVFVLGNGTEEVISFNIRMQDRAGNWSNIINTSTIVVKEAN